MERIKRSEEEFFFTTPERMGDPEFIEAIKRRHFSLFVIDEAHCISHWGHDFRPAYLKLVAAIGALGNPTVLALTATATSQVCDDIIQQLGRPRMHIINTGMYRDNLHYREVPVTSEHEKQEALLQILRDTEGPALVYAATLKSVNGVYGALRAAGFDACWYHGQMPAKHRNQNQERFMQGKCRIMVATNAFSMGIDKPNIRIVLHYQLPTNLEFYYEESVRAGRDGNPADCVLLYLPRDRQVQQFFLARRHRCAEDLSDVYAALHHATQHRRTATFDELHALMKAVPDARLQVALNLMKDDGIVAQEPDLSWRLIKRRLKNARLHQLLSVYREKSEHDHAALERMIFYAQTGFCRLRVILECFGEAVPRDRCGRCDNCRRPPEHSLSAQHVREHIPPSTRAAAPVFAIGMTVRVPRYGAGKVSGIEGEKIAVVFPDAQLRTFLCDYVHLA